MHSTIIVVLLKTAVLWAIWSLTYFSLKSRIGVDSSYEHRSQLAKAFFLCNVWCWSWALKTHRGPKSIFLSFQEIWVQTEVLKNKTYLRLVVATFWCFFPNLSRLLLRREINKSRYSNKNWLYSFYRILCVFTEKKSITKQCVSCAHSGDIQRTTNF